MGCWYLTERGKVEQKQFAVQKEEYFAFNVTETVSTYKIKHTYHLANCVKKDYLPFIGTSEFINTIHSNLFHW